MIRLPAVDAIVTTNVKPMVAINRSRHRWQRDHHVCVVRQGRKRVRSTTATLRTPAAPDHDVGRCPRPGDNPTWRRGRTESSGSGSTGPGGRGIGAPSRRGPRRDPRVDRDAEWASRSTLDRTSSVDAGAVVSRASGRTGRARSSPPQFGHTPPRRLSAHPGAERALERADPGVEGAGRQVLSAVLTGRSELEPASTLGRTGCGVNDNILTNSAIVGSWARPAGVGSGPLPCSGSEGPRDYGRGHVRRSRRTSPLP